VDEAFDCCLRIVHRICLALRETRFIVILYHLPNRYLTFQINAKHPKAFLTEYCTLPCSVMRVSGWVMAKTNYIASAIVSISQHAVNLLLRITYEVCSLTRVGHFGDSQSDECCIGWKFESTLPVKNVLLTTLSCTFLLELFPIVNKQRWRCAVRLNAFETCERLFMEVQFAFATSQNIGQPKKL